MRLPGTPKGRGPPRRHAQCRRQDVTAAHGDGPVGAWESHRLAKPKFGPLGTQPDPPAAMGIEAPEDIPTGVRDTRRLPWIPCATTTGPCLTAVRDDEALYRRQRGKGARTYPPIRGRRRRRRHSGHEVTARPGTHQARRPNALQWPSASLQAAAAAARRRMGVVSHEVGVNRPAAAAPGAPPSRATAACPPGRAAPRRCRGHPPRWRRRPATRPSR